MTNPVAPPLLSADDFALFQTSDPDWFLNTAGEIVRGFCQWHIAPNITVTDTVPIQPDGSIMLPTLYLTGVATVTIDGIDVDPSTYTFQQCGTISRLSVQQPYFEYPLWPLNSDRPFREYPSAVQYHADVTYSHGYSALPPQVAAVGYALCERAMEMPAGLATQISAGPQSITFGKLGLVLNEEERRLLGPYSLTGKRF